MTTLQGRATVLETTTAPLSVSGTPGTFPATLSITGVNVHILDGTGSTQSTSGLGNLIVGYNALGNDLGAGDVRTGSHNLILGDLNNYFSYGGLVAGRDNAIIGRYASVSGGVRNTASGLAASVSGGDFNTANGDFASVSGGLINTASGLLASVSGGYNNTAGSDFASVSGGQSLTQSARYGWTGGDYHTP